MIILITVMAMMFVALLMPFALAVHEMKHEHYKMGLVMIFTGVFIFAYVMLGLIQKATVVL